MSDAIPLSRVVRMHEVPPAGRVVSLVADPAQRVALAEALDILSVDALEAELTVTQTRRGARVKGTLRAEVVQACVVTLDPVPATISETIDLSFVRSEDLPPPGAEIAVDPMAADPPDVFDGEALDLGALVTEHLALGLDPYPRKPGATFEATDPDGGAAPESPFAALSRLKDRR